MDCKLFTAFARKGRANVLETVQLHLFFPSTKFMICKVNLSVADGAGICISAFKESLG